MDSEFLSIKEAAIIFSVHESTIRRALKRGYLGAIRIGDSPKSPYRISKKSIDAIHISIIKDLAQKAKKNG